jgi:CRISPR-associated Csx3 family protein
MTKPEFAIAHFQIPSQAFPRADICLVGTDIPRDTTPEELSEAMVESNLKTKMIGYGVVIQGPAPKWVFEMLRDAAGQSPWIAVQDPKTGIATVIRSRISEMEVGEQFGFRIGEGGVSISYFSFFEPAKKFTGWKNENIVR